MITIAPLSSREQQAFNLKWNLRDLEIKEGDNVVFSARNVSAPETWGNAGLTQVARLYFRGQGDQREHSVQQLIDRVVNAICAEAVNPSFGTALISSELDLLVFHQRLSGMILDQRAAFNTPVWINVGTKKHPQSSACFIQGVEDTMESIIALQNSETRLFKNGSGSGTDLSSLRPNGAPLSVGGTSSGPVSFMAGYDAWAGATKSGGKSRRAAKMVTLIDTHPDILQFIETKSVAQKMIRTLVAAGYGDKMDDVATSWARFQNANHSVRVSDAFMERVRACSASKTDEPWILSWESINQSNAVRKQTTVMTIWNAILDAAWECGDPGLMYTGTINKHNTVPQFGPIVSSNPCGEFLHPNDTACNLASIRLTKYFDSDGLFDHELFENDIVALTIAMEAIVGLSGYPTEAIARNSKNLRPLGLGFADLGALLMRLGVPYDSEQGRNIAASLTSLMAGIATKTSAMIAAYCGGPYAEYEKNQDFHRAVVQGHHQANDKNDSLHHPVIRGESPSFLAEAAWSFARQMMRVSGLRNSQLTVLAPTGTISMMMGCDTTGVEPDAALIKTKMLAGGGSVKQVNQSVKQALHTLLNHSDEEAEALSNLLEHGDFGKVLTQEQKRVFETAFGEYQMPADSHVKMVAAVQPFISGGVSKTVNLTAEATREDIGRIYIMAWEHGLKAVSIYRDGCKGAQPIVVTRRDTGEKPPETAPERHSAAIPGAPGKPNHGNDVAPQATTGNPWPTTTRRKLPKERQSMSRQFEIEGHDFYFTVGFFEDGRPGEVFVKAAKDGSSISGLLDSTCLMMSMALQHGAPFEKLLQKLRHGRFSPNGFTGDEEIPSCSSVFDAFAQWAQKFCKPATPFQFAEVTKELRDAMKTTQVVDVLVDNTFRKLVYGGSPCPQCGSMLSQTGSCKKCMTCGYSDGGCG